MINGTINDNRAQNNGGGIWATGNAIFTMTGGTINNNNATSGGGMARTAPVNQIRRISPATALLPTQRPEPEATHPDDYIFYGWALNQQDADNGIILRGEQSFAENQTLWASWGPSSEVV